MDPTIDFEKFFADSADFIGVLDAKGHASWLNARWTERLGWPDERLRADSLGSFFHDDDRDAIASAFDAALLQAHDVEDFTGRIRREEGESVWARWSLRRMPDGMVCISGRDLTDRMRITQDVARRKRLLELAARTAKVGYWRFELSSRQLTWSDTSYEMLGLTRSGFEVTARSVEYLYLPDDYKRVHRLIFGALSTEETVEFKASVRHANRNYIYTRNQVVAERDADGNPVALFGVTMDITEYEKSLQAIRHTALHDSLTMLGNRTMFVNRLNESLDRSRRNDRQVALVFMDLDHFKDVNDTLGHPIGDQLLIAFAQRLRDQVRATETLARLGGDEFAIVQMLDKSTAECEGLANRVMRLLREPFIIDGHHLQMSASMGIAVSPADGHDSDTLMRNADIALYRAKNEGRSTYRFFETDMDTCLRERRKLETELKAAIENKEFRLHYQPLFDTKTGRLCSLEALIRWYSPTRGVVAPEEFLPLAEQTRLMVPIGQWVMRQACKDAGLWPEDVVVAINVSAVEFIADSLIESLQSALQNAQISPERIELEITETALLKDGEQALRILHELRGLGVRIVMDDFGMGYSSLSYLRDFPFDKLKLDGSFVRDATAQTNDHAIVRAVASMAKALGIECTAEGVETLSQQELVHTEGYSQVQGFLHCEPLPAQDIVDEYFSADADVAAETQTPLS